MRNIPRNIGYKIIAYGHSEWQLTFWNYFFIKSTQPFLFYQEIKNLTLTTVKTIAFFLYE